MVITHGITESLFYLSRIQFGATAIFHFLFAPLTFGLSWLLVIMEAAYLKTGNIVYKDMVRFFGKLFAINFAMGVVTGITLEFEFGQNWAYFSRYIGDAFGPVLAIEGISAFMLEATLFGVFMFGWDKLSKKAHFLVTIFLAIGTNLSILNILVANSWMQHPIDTYFNYQTMHLHLTSLGGIYWSHLAQIRTGHVAFAGFLLASIFVMAVSSFYLFKNRDVAFAKRSFAIGVGFGLMAVLMVFFYGDANGIAVSKNEPAKMAAIEGQWVTQKAPASWYAFAWPSNSAEKNYAVLPIPYALSLIATHSLTGTVEGLKPIMAQNKKRIESGMIAYGALQKMRGGDNTAYYRHLFAQHQKDLGFGFLLSRYAPKVTNATSTQINQATKDSIPEVFPVFWAFRIMIACWGLMTIMIIIGFYFTVRNTLHKHRFYLFLAMCAIILPYLAVEFGWVTAEVGRQPWTVHEVLPTFLSTSSLSAATVAFSVGGFFLFYTILFLVEIYLMIKFVRIGPSSLGEGRYHFEKPSIRR